MAGWYGAIIGAIVGLVLGQHVVDAFPDNVVSTLGENGAKVLVALLGAWLGAFLGDVFGVLTERKR